MRTFRFVCAAVVAFVALPTSSWAQTKKPAKWEGSIKVADDEGATQLARLLRLVTLGDAEKSALDSLKGDSEGRAVREVEIDVLNESLVYEVEVIDSAAKATSIVIVDAGNGKVLETAVSAHEWQGSQKVEWKTSIVDAEKAALGDVEGEASHKRAVDIELQVVNGYIVFEVIVVVSGDPGVYEVVVDANSGKVLEVVHTVEED